jgi:hypothetical protein
MRAQVTDDWARRSPPGHQAVHDRSLLEIQYKVICYLRTESDMF